MKKTYIAPALELTKMDANDIIATSIPVNDFISNEELLGRDSDWVEVDF